MRRKNKLHRLFIAYSYKNGMSFGFGNYQGFEARRKNVSTSDIRAMEEALMKKFDYENVVVTNYRFMGDQG